MASPVNYYRPVDLDLMFSNAVSLTVTTATYSSEIDMGGIYMGDASAVRGVVQIGTISATAASTIAVAVYASTAATATTKIMTIETVTGSAAFERHFTLPADCARYIRLGYTLGATAASSCVITAFLAPEVEK